MKKLFLGLLLCALLVAVVTACGGNNNNNEDPPANDNGQEAAPDPDPQDDEDEDEEWDAPELPDEPDEPDEPEAPGLNDNVERVLTPTSGRLLGNADGAALTRAEILEFVNAEPAPAGELVVADVTRISGNFIYRFTTEATGGWARDLLHTGFGTMIADYFGEFHPNPLVIRQPTTFVDNPDGTRTYTFYIYTDNLWSDGTPITAIDYVFDIIMGSSPAMREGGATVNAGLWVEGFNEFLNGRTYSTELADRQFLDEDGNFRTDLVFYEGAWIDEDGETVTTGVPTNYYAGLRLHGDDSFSVTIRAEGIPFVFDFLYQSWAPMPFHYFNAAGGGVLSLIDTPNGVRFEGLDGDFVSEFINAPGAIRFNPTVVSGPYMLRDFDEGDATVILEANPNFVGTWDGFRPQIQTVAIVLRNSDVIMDSLRIGEVDMVHAQRSGLRINEGWAVVNDLGLHRGFDYPRHGYGYMAWHGDHGPGQFANVRRAIAWMIDRYDFARQFTLGFGTVQHGPYALTGWEFRAVGQDLYNHPDFTHYGFNPARAIEELEAGGWVLNSAGEPFDSDVDQWRYKDVTGMYTWTGDPVQDTGAEQELMRLELIWAANDNDVSNIMRVVLPPVAESVGMHIIEELYPAGTNNIPAWQRAPGTPYTSGGERFQAHHMYTLAVGLANPSQLWQSWSNAPEFAAPGFNNTWHGDQLLSDIADRMRPIDAAQPGWRDEYLDLWMQFQLRYNYVMPLLPLYADDDHDFVPLWLGNWSAHSNWGFAAALQRAYDGRTR